MRKISPRLIYFFGALGGLLFGYDTGVISGAILYVKRTLDLTALEEGMVVSSVLLGAMIGAMSIGPLSDKFGRKKMVMFAALIFLIGSLGSAFSPEFITLVLSRVVLGIAVGGASALVPTYLAEVAPAKMRGSLTSLNQLMVMSGILMAYIINYAFSGMATPFHGVGCLVLLPFLQPSCLSVVSSYQNHLVTLVVSRSSMRLWLF